MGGKEWGLGSLMAASRIRQWQFFRLQGKSYVCMVWGKRMARQWGLAMTREWVSRSEFKNERMVSKMGLKVQIWYCKMGFCSSEMGLEKREREGKYLSSIGAHTRNGISFSSANVDNLKLN